MTWPPRWRSGPRPSLVVLFPCQHPAQLAAPCPPLRPPGNTVPPPLEYSLFPPSSLPPGTQSEHPPYDLAPEVVQRAEAIFQEMLARGVTPNQVAFHTLMDVQV